MAKKPLARKHAEDYESDDGFVEDAPKSKKIKTEVKPRNTTMQQDDEGNEYWEVGEVAALGFQDFQLTESIAVGQTKSANLQLQRQHDGQHPRILRKQRKDVAREEGRCLLPYAVDSNTPLTPHRASQ